VVRILDSLTVIDRTAEHVRRALSTDHTGHDWWHTDRVRKNALRIAREEHADMFIVELAALLHDIADWKFRDGDHDAGAREARQWLEKLNLAPDAVDRVCTIIDEVSFKGAGVQTTPSTLEGMVVQDADRLDALGAIGIARAFSYGGHKGNPIHDPGASPSLHQSFEEYKNRRSTTNNHFHEKLLLLKDRMNTTAGRRLADERHRFLESYLDRFLAEWEGRM
jgi:uncharacterized protein